MSTTDLEVQTNELANRRLDAGLAEGNGVIDPARWQMLAAIAETVYSTAFVPVGLRDSKPSTLACLLYGDSLGLHPMASLKEIHVIDGVPGLSAAAMSALVRKARTVKGEPAGHKLWREEIREENGTFLGVKAFGERGDDGTRDEYTFTVAMAVRANLMGKHNWKSYPEAMCTARAFSQICTFLFSDVFMGSPLMPEELEGIGATEAPGPDEEGHVVVHPPQAPAAAEEPAEGSGETVEGRSSVQAAWEVRDADDPEHLVAVIDADDYKIVKGADTDVIRFDGASWQIVGYEVDGESSLETIIVRLVKAAPEPKAEKPAEGTPAAVIREGMPKVFEYVLKAREAGDRQFIEGVLAAELERKPNPRARLVDSLNDTLREMAVEEPAENADAETKDAEAKEADATDAELPEPVASGSPTSSEVEKQEEGGGFQPFEPEPEPTAVPEPVGDADLLSELDPEIPYAAATKRAKVTRLSALCAYMHDQHPEARSWHLGGVVAAGAKQWNMVAHSLDDFDEEQLGKIWMAAEQHTGEAVQVLATMEPATIVKLAGQA